MDRLEAKRRLLEDLTKHIRQSHAEKLKAKYRPAPTPVDHAPAEAAPTDAPDADPKIEDLDDDTLAKLAGD